jgi:hypothetical protein
MLELQLLEFETPPPFAANLSLSLPSHKIISRNEFFCLVTDPLLPDRIAKLYPQRHFVYELPVSRIGCFMYIECGRVVIRETVNDKVITASWVQSQHPPTQQNLKDDI